MAQMYTELSDKHSEFIAAQKMYFVGTATADSRINVSPKGMDSLRVSYITTMPTGPRCTRCTTTKPNAASIDGLPTHFVTRNS